MDFSKIKSWFIPEGKVKSVAVGGKVIWQAPTDEEVLTAPTISLDGDTLTITATDERTETFAILVDGEEVATVLNLISFTINGTEYQAVNGMTWAEWCDSAYSSGYHVITEDGFIARLGAAGTNEITLDGTESGRVKSTDTIIGDTKYVHTSHGSGSN